MTIHALHPMTHAATTTERPCLTLPGEKDSMTAYTAERAPELAPFVFFPRSETPGYHALYRIPFMDNLHALTECDGSCNNPFCAGDLDDCRTHARAL